MADFTLGAQEFGQVIPSDFAEYISTVSGRSIVSGADWGHDRFELGLSGDGMIRVFWTPTGLRLNFISTTNRGDIPPLILQLVDEQHRQPARILEQRIRALRNLYALVHLNETGRLHSIQELLLTKTQPDFEEVLTPDEWLYVECLAPGSWYITVWSKLRSSYKSILQTVMLVYGRGREALLKKLEAEARLKELDVEKKEFELFTSKVDYGLNLIDRLDSEPARHALRDRVSANLSDFLLKDRNSPDVVDASRRLLERGKDAEQGG